MILPTEPPTLRVDRFAIWLGAVTDNTSLAHPIDSTEWGVTRLALHLALLFDPHLDKTSVEAVRERWEAVTEAWHGRSEA